jgi:hypothetical protein
MKISGKSNKSNLHSRINYEQNKFWECLLPSSSESVFRPLFKSLWFKNIQNHNLPVVLYGYKTSPLTVRKGHGLRVLRIFGPKREAGEDRIMRSFITCTLH